MATGSGNVDEVSSDRNSEASQDLRQRYQAWLMPLGSADPQWYAQGLLILDSSVLLKLYELTDTAREGILDTLERVAERLWLPEHVGREVVRRRRACVERRREAFRELRQEVNNALQAAAKQLGDVRNRVEEFARNHSRDDGAAVRLRGLITNEAFQSLSEIQSWKQGLLNEIGGIEQGYGLRPDQIDGDDPVLARLGELFGDRIGTGIDESETARLVRHAIDYRYPNLIPPGYKDAAGAKDKGTDLGRAGDYLIWEEILRHASGRVRRPVLLVTLDQTEDWWTLDKARRPMAARPELIEEMYRRAGVDFRLETLNTFMDGLSAYLDVAVTEEVAAELRRVSDEAAVKNEPVLSDTFDAAGFTSPETWDELRQNTDFAEWLVAVHYGAWWRDTGEPGSADARTVALLDEPRTRNTAPAQGWQRFRLPAWGGIHDAWVAPWLPRLLNGLPVEDAKRLRFLVGRSLSPSPSAEAESPMV